MQIASLEDRGMGFVALRFTDEAFRRFGEGARILSVSVPVARAVPVENATQFLRGLLPEGAALEDVARTLRVSTSDTFGLLRELGRDCAGALVITPVGAEPTDADDVDWLEEQALLDWIDALPDNPLGVDAAGEVRLSLAGIQDKLVVRVDSERRTIGRPLHGAPSTHILKPSSRAVDRRGGLRTPELVENEAFCMILAERAGLSVATVAVLRFGGEPCLLIERYDRRVEGDRVERIHQEDACQALGIDPLHKYEAQGGPSLASVAELIREYHAEPLRDLYQWLDLAVFNCVIGNLDAHGKNVSFLHHLDGRITLAPAYDLVAVSAYAALAAGTLAMRVGRAERLADVDVEALLTAATAIGLPESVGLRRLSRQLDAIEQALEPACDVARVGGWHSPLIAEIVAAVQDRISGLRLRDGDRD